MKNILSATFLTLVLSACSLFTVPDEKNQPEWSGTIPPLYWRVAGENDSRANFLFPLAWFRDGGAPLYTPLFGWDKDQTYCYWLTPLADYRNRQNGVVENGFFIFSARSINTDSQPSAASFDGGLFPLFNIETPTVSNGVKTQQYSVLSLLGIYEDASTEMPAESDFDYRKVKTSRAGYTHELATVCDSEKALAAIQNTQDLFFFWIAKQTQISRDIDTFLCVYETGFDYYFPIVYRESSFGKYFEKRKDGTSGIRNADEERLLIFPLFDYQRSAQNFSYQGPVILWYNSHDEAKQRDFWSFLWFFDHSKTPDTVQTGFLWRMFRLETGSNPQLYLFFIPLLP